MVKDAGTIRDIMPKFLEFIGDCTLVAHNADFDLGFIRHNCEELGLEFKNKHIDTLMLSRQAFPHFKKHKLGLIAEKLGIRVTNAHRALGDVKMLVQIIEKMQDVLQNGMDDDVGATIGRPCSEERTCNARPYKCGDTQNYALVSCDNSSKKLYRVKKLIQTYINISLRIFP